MFFEPKLGDAFKDFFFYFRDVFFLSVVPSSLVSFWVVVDISSIPLNRSHFSTCVEIVWTPGDL